MNSTYPKQRSPHPIDKSSALVILFGLSLLSASAHPKDASPSAPPSSSDKKPTPMIDSYESIWKSMPFLSPLQPRMMIHQFYYTVCYTEQSHRTAEVLEKQLRRYFWGNGYHSLQFDCHLFLFGLKNDRRSAWVTLWLWIFRSPKNRLNLSFDRFLL